MLKYFLLKKKKEKRKATINGWITFLTIKLSISPDNKVFVPPPQKENNYRQLVFEKKKSS